MNECQLFLRRTKRTSLFTALPPHHENNPNKIEIVRNSMKKDLDSFHIFFFTVLSTIK